MKNIAIVIITVFCALLESNGQHPYEYNQPKTLNDGWETANLKALQIDSTRIYQFFSQAHQGGNKLHSVLLVKNNRLIIEEYFNGHSASEQHDLRSVTKSIRSLLLGIAIDKGYINSINDPISNYLKESVPTKNLDDRKAQITIKHLITMSTGLDCNDWDKNSKGQEDKVYRKNDWVQYTLNLPMMNDPGAVSNYCSMGALLLAEVIRMASGMSIDEFAEAHLFRHLGIKQASWGHTSNKEVISSGKRLYITSRDMAKIGQLVLNNGMWNEYRVISEAWIEEATTPKTKITGIDYGYFWWNLPFKLNDRTIISKLATGNGGQYIMVLPALDLVAVFTGGAYNSQEDKLPFAIVQDVFLATFKN